MKKPTAISTTPADRAARHRPHPVTGRTHAPNQRETEDERPSRRGTADEARSSPDATPVKPMAIARPKASIVGSSASSGIPTTEIEHDREEGDDRPDQQFGEQAHGERRHRRRAGAFARAADGVRRGGNQQRADDEPEQIAHRARDEREAGDPRPVRPERHRHLAVVWQHDLEVVRRDVHLTGFAADEAP